MCKAWMEMCRGLASFLHLNDKMMMKIWTGWKAISGWHSMFLVSHRPCNDESICYWHRSSLNQLRHVWAGQEEGCSHISSSSSRLPPLLVEYFLLSFCDPVLVSAEVSEHIKWWWRLTGFYGVLWSCRLQLWGEDSLSFPAASFVWALGIVEKEEVKPRFWKRIQMKPYFPK